MDKIYLPIVCGIVCTIVIPVLLGTVRRSEIYTLSLYQAFRPMILDPAWPVSGGCLGGVHQ